MTRLPTLIAALLATVVLAACGGEDEGASTPPPAPTPTAKAEDFPAAGSTTLTELAGMAGAQGPFLAPSVSILEKGRNRFAFALFDVARKQIAGARVAVYTARPDGTGVRGPYVARTESLAVKPQFQGRLTATDPDNAKAIYVVDLPFSRTGTQRVMAVVRLDGRTVVTDQVPIQVGPKGAQPPKVGQPAIRIDTPTRGDVGGNLEKIDTRIPPLAEFHRKSLAEVLGRKPVVLLFSTPRLCQTRVCGPVYDIAHQVQADVGDAVEFIQMEIYKDNEISKGFRPQVGAYKLPTEPWLFVVDRTGKVAARFEGAFSAGELERAVAKVT